MIYRRGTSCQERWNLPTEKNLLRREPDCNSGLPFIFRTLWSIPEEIGRQILLIAAVLLRRENPEKGGISDGFLRYNAVWEGRDGFTAKSLRRKGY